MFSVPEDLTSLPADPAGMCDLIRRFLVGWQVMEVAEASAANKNEVLAAEQRLGLKLPYALRWMFMHIGFDNHVVGHQDPFVHPRSLEVDKDGVLIYRFENQHCAAWGFPVGDTGMDDPPVLWKDLQAGSEGRWLPYQERLSVDLFEMALNEAMLRPGVSVLHMELVSGVPSELSNLVSLAIPEHVFWPMPDGPLVAWYGARDCLVRRDADVWLWAFGPTPSALDVVRRAIPGQWEQMQE